MRLSKSGRAVAVGVAVAATAAAIAVATPGSGIVRTQLGRATLEPFHVQSNDYKVHSKNTTDMVVQHVTVGPGGHTGWHTHFGPAFILVQSGTFSLTHADGCTAHVYTAGQGFVEAGNDVHIGRNVSSTEPVEIVAAYTNVPVGGGVATSVDAPNDCK